MTRWLAAFPAACMVIAGALLTLAGCLSDSQPRPGTVRIGDMALRGADNAATPARLKASVRYVPNDDPIFHDALSTLSGAVKAAQCANPSPDEAAGWQAALATLKALPASETTIDAESGTPDMNAEVRIAKDAAEIESRKPLLWAGIPLIVIGLLVATVAKYPTPGGLLALCGASLIGMHSYPWLGMLACGLGAAAIAIVLGYEIAERSAKTSSTK